MIDPSSENARINDPLRERASRPLRWWAPALGALLVPVALIGQSWAAAHPEWVEEHYSREIFPSISSRLARFAEPFPMSLAELLIALLLVGVVVGVVRNFRRLIHPGESLSRRLVILLNGGLRIAALAGVLYCGYLASWGLNHHRLSFADAAGWEVSSPTSDELVQLACLVTDDLSRIRADLEEDEAGLSRLVHSQTELTRLAREAFGNLEELHPSLRVAPGVPRRPLLSPLLTASGISGVYSPFTAEAHVNGEIPDMQRGFVTCHELAHSLGFAREDEANFLAYLACKNSGDPSLRYSGQLAAWRYLRGPLARANPTRLIGIKERLRPPVLLDLQAMQEFWQRKHSSITKIGTKLNNSYLVSQGQTSGVATYGLAVDLLVADWRRSEPNYSEEPLLSAMREVEERVVRVAFVGGCFTSGGKEPERRGFPDRVGEMLSAAGISASIYNLGSCHQRSESTLRAVHAAIEVQADVVVLEYGAADLSGGESPASLKEGFEQAMRAARQAGLRVLVLTGIRADLARNLDRAVALDDMLRSQAEIRGLSVVTFFTDGIAGERSALRADLEHPNLESVWVLADRVVPQLRKVIRRVRRAWALEWVESGEGEASSER